MGNSAKSMLLSNRGDKMRNNFNLTADNSDRISDELVPTVLGEEECERSHSFGPYIREYFLIHYCISGKGTFLVNGKTYEVGKGEIFIICPGQLTVYTADRDDPWHYSWIGFSGKEAKRIKNLPPVMAYPAETFLRIAEFARMGVRNYEIYLSFIYEILYYLFSDRELNTDVCKQVKDYIRLNYMHPLTVEGVCARFGLNRRYLSRIFKAKYGVALKEYIVTVRCRMAAEFLKKGYNVSEASMMTGYSDQFAFSKMFRKVLGVPPSEYRKRK